MERRRAILAMLVSAASLAACAGASRQVHPIEGSWNIVEATQSGRSVPLSAFGAGLLTLDAGNYEFQKDRGDYAVLPAGTSPGAPAGLDLHGREGPNAGRTILAAFAVTIDTLTICYDLSGKERPTSLQATAGNGFLLVRYRRA